MAKNRTDGGWRYGELPDTAPLAMAYVPLQRSVSPAYESMEALSRGTLFPGLDLPFMGMVNQTQEVTPLTEMMALCTSWRCTLTRIRTTPRPSPCIRAFSRLRRRRGSAM